MRRIDGRRGSARRLAAVALASLFAGVVGLGLTAAPAFAAGGTASATPVSPGGPGTANCPPGPPASVGAGLATVSGVTLTGMSGVCTLSMAKATVSVATFGGVEVDSITSMCTVGSNTPTFSALYNGMTISSPQTIHVNGYTLNFGEAVTVGATHGLTALDIKTPTGAHVKLATTLCNVPYPMAVGSAKVGLAGQTPAGFSSQATHGTAARSFPAVLVLMLAVGAFVAVNVMGVRTFRRRQQTSGS